MPRKTKRIIFLILTIALLIGEVLIAKFIHGGFIRNTFGDVLVVILLYSFVRIFIPDKVRLLPLYVFLFACLVEFMQYIHIVEILGLQNNKFFCTLIGTSFSWSDIVAYAAGCIVVGIYEVIIFVKEKSSMATQELKH